MIFMSEFISIFQLIWWALVFNGLIFMTVFIWSLLIPFVVNLYEWSFDKWNKLFFKYTKNNHRERNKLAYVVELMIGRN